MFPQVRQKKIADILTERIATIGENIQIRRFKRMTGNLFAYTHNGGGSIIGSMIKIEADDVDSDAVKACAKDLLLQITASAPQFVAQADVPASVIEAEKEVQLKLVQNENEQSAKPKPQNVLEKIVDGRMRKFAEEICLLDQPYVKILTLQLLSSSLLLAKNIKVVEFVRFEKGEEFRRRKTTSQQKLLQWLSNYTDIIKALSKRSGLFVSGKSSSYSNLE